MRRRKPATPKLILGDAWALGRRYRRLSVRVRKPITMSVVLAVVVALTGPTAFAEDPITDPNAPATTESPSPAPDPSPSPAADPITDPSPAPSPEPSTAPATEPSSTPTVPEVSPEPSPSSVLPVGNPTISSDKDDYPPGGAVILTGTNWQPGEIVHIRVNDDAGETWRRDVDVIADGNGSIRDEFLLPEWFVATYTVTATGPVSGIATATFTDGSVRVQTIGSSGTPATVGWVLYNSMNCALGTEVAGPSGSGSISAGTSGNGTDVGTGATASQSLKLTAGTLSGFAFSSWDSGNFSSTTANPTCLTGANSTQNTHVNYTANAANTAPTISNIADQTINEDSEYRSPRLYGR